jgi:hypothetical protein
MKRMIKQIVDYAEGRSTEEEAMDLWAHTENLESSV